MSKNTIMLTETELKNLIKESVKTIIKEGVDYKTESFDMLENLKNCLGADQLCDRLANRLAGQIDYRGLYETLQEIYQMECNNSDDLY